MFELYLCLYGNYYALAPLLQGDDFVFEDHQLGSDMEGVAIKAEFLPLVIETMTKFDDKQEVGLQWHQNNDFV